jgi:hypothetical protein
MTVVFKLRRDTSSNWTNINPTLALGEPGVETDTHRTKYGDGFSAWRDLSYSTVAFPDTVANAGTALNISGGLANKIVYQVGPGTTGFISAPAPSTVAYLTYTGTAFGWSTTIPTSALSGNISTNSLSGVNLPSAIVTSSLTSVGTLTNLTVTNTIVGSVSGNAGTATALATGRTINGITFDGTAPITITAAANTLTSDTLNSSVINSSLTSVGTLTGLTVSGNSTISGTLNVGGLNIKSLAVAMGAALA